jgi:hypothetical protein
MSPPEPYEYESAKVIVASRLSLAVRTGPARVLRPAAWTGTAAPRFRLVPTVGKDPLHHSA